MDQQTDNNQTPPGSLNFTPANPELGPVETIVPSIEIPKPETEKPQEKLTQTPEASENKEEAAINQPVTGAQKPNTQKIVDKSKEPLHLHPIKTPKDNLTKEADAEEEDFINQVESAHEHK